MRSCGSKGAPPRLARDHRAEDRDAWWASYRAFVLHYAELAASRNVGCTRSAASSSAWSATKRGGRELIAAVRDAFHGKLTYSANWDHYEPIAFWTRSTYSASPRITGAGAPAFTAKLHAYAAMIDRRYVITEVGYPSTAAAPAAPWDHRASGPPDQTRKLACYRACSKLS